MGRLSQACREEALKNLSIIDLYPQPYIVRRQAFTLPQGEQERMVGRGSSLWGAHSAPGAGQLMGVHMLT